MTLKFIQIFIFLKIIIVNIIFIFNVVSKVSFDCYTPYDSIVEKIRKYQFQ